MRGIFTAILLCFISWSISYAQSYGLRFSSHEAVQEKRTSLNITPNENICLHKDPVISFDLVFAPHLDVYFGYVFRLITAANQNIDLIYNQKLGNFNLIIGETPTVTFTIDSPRLYTKWTHLEFRFDLEAHSLSIYENYAFAAKRNVDLGKDLCFRMIFGASSFEDFRTGDIPPMSLRDLKIFDDGGLQYYWPLSETSGGDCYDSVGKKVAKAVNPIWIKPQHQDWQLAATLHIDGTPGVAFDPGSETIYLAGEDSLFAWTVQRGAPWSVPLSRKDAFLPPGNQSIFDPRTGRMYNVYIDLKKVRTFVFGSYKWDEDYPSAPLTEFWHANKFLSYEDTSLYIVGGYGQLHYKNVVQRYRLSEKKWEVLATGGDHFAPRYLAGLGTNASGDSAFIIGGYGSNTGDQMVNPRYDYDLVVYSVRNRTFKTIYRLKEPEQPFCFANSLVIDDTSREYYGLIYPNDKFNSALQLIKGSLVTPTYQPVGDQIPYSFYDVKSFADLYYDPQSQTLVAVTMYTNKANITEVKIYTLAFPPNPIPAPVMASGRAFPWRYAILLLVVLGIVGAVLLRRRKKATRKTPDPVVTHAPPVLTPALPADGRSAILFFGQFEVYDKEGTELTKLFTPLLKELFLLITIYTLRSGKGVSSEKLYATLWRDKSNKDAQNNRSVNMVKLKAILDKMGTCGIGKEADKWVFHYLPGQIRVDMAEFLALVQTHSPSQEEIRHLLSIVHRGTFLSDTVYPWLDDIQSEVSDRILDVLSAACLRWSHDPEFLLEIAGGIFLFDPVNEEALRVRCKILSGLGRHSQAKAAFEKFAKEYHQMYGEEFQHSFHEILSN
jgi:two-component SAPR family response regulator